MRKQHRFHYTSTDFSPSPLVFQPRGGAEAAPLRVPEFKTFAFCLGAFMVLSWCASLGRGQGVLTNGAAQDGSIATVGGQQSWNIQVAAGDRVVVQIAELSGGALFTPKIELFSPDGRSQGNSSGSLAARLDAQAAGAGNYVLIVSDALNTGTGTYRLQLAQLAQPPQFFRFYVR